MRSVNKTVFLTVVAFLATALAMVSAAMIFAMLTDIYDPAAHDGITTPRRFIYIQLAIQALIGYGVAAVLAVRLRRNK